MVEPLDLSGYLFVVEGKNDRFNLEQSFNQKLNIVETEGSRISLDKQNLLKELSAKYQLVILTDPDVQGERIRKIVTKLAPDAIQLFVNKQAATPKSDNQSLGVEHVNQGILLQLLNRLEANSPQNFQAVTMDDLYQYKLIGFENSQIYRHQISEKLNIGYTNGKQFLKRLRLMKIDRDKFLETVKQLADESNWNN